MGQKASLSETNGTQIVILHKEGFLSKKDLQKSVLAKRLFINQLLDFKILDFTMKRKGVKGQEKQAHVMTI